MSTDDVEMTDQGHPSMGNGSSLQECLSRLAITGSSQNSLLSAQDCLSRIRIRKLNHHIQTDQPECQCCQVAGICRIVMPNEVHLHMNITPRDAQVLLRGFLELATRVAEQHFPQPDIFIGLGSIENVRVLTQFLIALRALPECSLGSHFTIAELAAFLCGIIAGCNDHLTSQQQHPPGRRVQPGSSAATLVTSIGRFLEAAWFWNDASLTAMIDAEKARKEEEEEKAVAKVNGWSMNAARLMREAEVRDHGRYKSESWWTKTALKPAGVVKKSVHFGPDKAKKDRVAKLEKAMRAMEIREKHREKN